VFELALTGQSVLQPGRVDLEQTRVVGGDADGREAIGRRVGSLDDVADDAAELFLDVGHPAVAEQDAGRVAAGVVVGVGVDLGLDGVVGGDEIGDRLLGRVGVVGDGDRQLLGRIGRLKLERDAADEVVERVRGVRDGECAGAGAERDRGVLGRLHGRHVRLDREGLPRDERAGAELDLQSLGDVLERTDVGGIDRDVSRVGPGRVRVVQRDRVGSDRAAAGDGERVRVVGRPGVAAGARVARHRRRAGEAGPEIDRTDVALVEDRRRGPAGRVRQVVRDRDRVGGAGRRRGQHEPVAMGGRAVVDD
jgi:hypothetical protein